MEKLQLKQKGKSSVFFSHYFLLKLYFSAAPFCATEFETIRICCHLPLRHRIKKTIALKPQSKIAMEIHAPTAPKPNTKASRYAPPKRNTHIERMETAIGNFTSPAARREAGRLFRFRQCALHRRIGLRRLTAVYKSQSVKPRFHFIMAAFRRTAGHLVAIQNRCLRAQLGQCI